MVQTIDTIYACRCLNVRIQPQPRGDGPSQSLRSDPEYESVYVGDEGISISNPHLTLRSRCRGVSVPDPDPDPEKQRCNRYMTLSCLICQIVVYRVLQNIPANMEEKAGPILPTDDWVEQEILRSATGWIELHKGCLTDDAISIAEKSPAYSSVFAVVLPSLPPAPVEAEPDAIYTTVSQSSPPHTPSNYLPNLRAIFPPPPFTPSHPVFVHLSSVAADKSQALRTDAENHIAEVVKAKVAEIEKAENELRSNVETLWRAFREGLGRVEQERSRSSTRTPQRTKDNENSLEGTDAGSSKPSPALVSIRDFNPVPNPSSRRVTSPTCTPRVSSLSVSLATSGFHHPRAQTHQSRSALPHVASTANENLRSPPPYSSNPSSPRTSDSYSSLSSPSSKSLSLRASLDGPTYLEPFKRNMNQTNDTATSFRYFAILEADKVRSLHKERETSVGTAHGSHDGAETSRTERKSEKSNSSGSRSSKDQSSSNHQETKGTNETSETNGQENGTKGKRKVTFDVKPEVVTIAREVKAERTEPSEPLSEEMIFDLEDGGIGREVFGSYPVLPLNEPPVAPTRPRHTRTGLPSSFSSLRPASLPAPSAVRPPRPFDTEDTPQPKKSVQRRKESPQRDAKQAAQLVEEEDTDTIDPREAEFLKLVAADTPSHRGAWKKDSKAWQLFVRRRGGKDRQSDGLIPEEDEDDPNVLTKLKDDDTDGESDSDARSDSTWTKSQLADIAVSLPIAIHPLTQTREPLSLASYQPKTSLSDRPGILVPALHPHRKSASSSAAWRKAAYAARDRSRYMDPGTLDFVHEDDDDDDDDEGEAETTRTSADQEGRGRQHALKILHLRSEIPASGMWRSLAT